MWACTMSWDLNPEDDHYLYNLNCFNNKEGVMRDIACGLFLGACLISVVAVGYGGINNIVKLCKADFEPSYKCEILRGVGVAVPPVGVVLGYCKFDEERNK